MKYLLEIIRIDIMVMVMAMVPVVELRGAIPVGIALGLSPFWSMIISVIGSTLPVPFILIGIRPLFSYLKKIDSIQHIIERITKNAMNKSSRVTKYGFLGLIVFVGIPLPGTGAWSGSLIAALLDMRIKRALLAIFFGNLIAGTIIYYLSYTTFNLLNILP